jgi:hypothetical protein
MFRALTILGVSVCAFGIAASAFRNSRVRFSRFTFDRRTQKLRFWLVLLAYLLAGSFALGWVSLDVRQGIFGIGPYADQPFLSFHEPWPYAVFALFVWSVIGMIAYDHFWIWRHRK